MRERYPLYCSSVNQSVSVWLRDRSNARTSMFTKLNAQAIRRKISIEFVCEKKPLELIQTYSKHLERYVLNGLFHHAKRKLMAKTIKFWYVWLYIHFNYKMAANQRIVNILVGEVKRFYYFTGLLDQFFTRSLTKWSRLYLKTVWIPTRRFSIISPGPSITRYNVLLPF